MRELRIAEVESIVVADTHYVRITTDDGITGLGQSGAWAYNAAVHSIVEQFKAYLIGQDPLRIEHHWQHLYRMAPFRGSILSAGISAVDIALWDIKGKHFQAPIWQLLGASAVSGSACTRSCPQRRQMSSQKWLWGRSKRASLRSSSSRSRAPTRT